MKSKLWRIPTCYRDAYEKWFITGIIVGDTMVSALRLQVVGYFRFPLDIPKQLGYL